MRALARILDTLVLLLLGVWLAGGIPWNGKLLLKHGADPRRAALLLGLVLFAVASLRSRSLVVRAVERVVDRLEKSSRLRWAVLAAVATFASVLGALQALALRYPLWDVGIYHQIVWNLSQGQGFGSSLSGAGDFLRDHLSVSLALLAPLMDLTGASPLFMPVIQPWLVFGAVAAWIYLAERLGGPAKGWLPAAVLVFGVWFDSLWANFRWGPHESMIDLVALSWMFALLFSWRPSYAPLPGLISKDNAIRALILVLALIAAGTKEILLLDAAIALGLWSFFSCREKRYGWSGLLLGFAVSLLVGFVYFEQMPHAPGKNYFMRYYSYLGTSLPEFAVTLAFKPWKVVQNVGALELVRYVLVVFLPFLFLPFVSSRRIWMLTLAPSFFSAALSTDLPLRRSGFHYVFELWPVLAALTVIALAEWRSPRMPARRLAWIWAFCALLAMDQDPWNQLHEYRKDAARVRVARTAIAAIEPEHSLMADEMAGTWVANRVMLARWPEIQSFAGVCPERVLLPLGDRELRDYPGAREILERCTYSPMWGAGDWVLFKLVARPD
ncbi:MAG TPA: DUF2079 domain-containing protein [Bdellovibrionota bacterium]|nr:DUF2079 domain-containing protein [Bdellovibrionota bacterium]